MTLGLVMVKQKTEKTFGACIRAWREEKEIGLRKFADLVGISPTYLSKIERNEFPPPGEEKVIAIARELEKDPDELLALAGRVASDLEEIIQQTPREMATFLRAARGMSPKDIEQLTKQVERKNRK